MSVFSYENLYRAYLDCRKNKRNKPDALMFEMNAEENLYDLCNELREKSYRPSTSVCFVTQKPKLREIFAADFRDRILHHLVVRYLEKIWERIFIYDSFASRQGKGIHLAVKRLRAFTRKSTCNGTKTAFYMQLDVRNFFMSISKDILYELIRAKCRDDDILWLTKTIIFHDPTEDYLLKSPKSLIRKIPRQKSLFDIEENKGLPIGNLTSQFFANIYLNGLDQFVKHELKCRYYVRYVDDFILTDVSREKLLEWHDKIVRYLDESLKLELKPEKIILPVNNGINFLGYIVRPDYVLCRNRVVNNLKERLKNFGQKLVGVENSIRTIRYDNEIPDELFACLNSYLGHFRHADTHRLIKSIFEKFPFLGYYFSHDKDGLKRLYLPPKRFPKMKNQYFYFFGRYHRSLIFFQTGCFYEFYNAQAGLAKKALNLKRIKRKYGFRRRCGIGVKALDRYVSTALQSGYSVVISNLNYYTAINCRAITGCPYGTNQSPGGTAHNRPEIHFREIFSGKHGYFSGLILS